MTLTKEKLRETIEEVFSRTENDKKRHIKLFVFGSIEQMEMFIRDFDESIKKEIRKQYDHSS